MEREIKKGEQFTYTTDDLKIKIKKGEDGSEWFYLYANKNTPLILSKKTFIKLIKEQHAQGKTVTRADIYKAQL